MKSASSTPLAVTSPPASAFASDSGNSTTRSKPPCLSLRLAAPPSTLTLAVQSSSVAHALSPRSPSLAPTVANPTLTSPKPASVSAVAVRLTTGALALPCFLPCFVPPHFLPLWSPSPPALLWRSQTSTRFATTSSFFRTRSTRMSGVGTSRLMPSAYLER